MKEKPIYMIVAYDSNRGIGYKNALPWCLPEDLINFKKITTSVKDPEKQNMIIMGKNTWRSLPKRPLPNRLNMILSTHIPLEYPVTTKGLFKHCVCLDDAILTANMDDSIENIYIIGGGQLYNYVLDNNICEKIYVTKVEGSYKTDTTINEINKKYYTMKNVEKGQECEYITYERVF
jgi:dihydrofolate reductase